MLEVRGCVAGFLCGGQDWKRVTGMNTPPIPPAAATPAPQAKGGAMAPQAKNGTMAPQQATKGMAKAAPAAGPPPADPICSNVASLVPRT